MSGLQRVSMALAVSTQAGWINEVTGPPPDGPCLPSDPPDADCAAAQTTEESEPGIASP